jgi:HPt (histidine-containing phosphotransfer) domain-containing protein
MLLHNAFLPAYLELLKDQHADLLQLGDRCHQAADSEAVTALRHLAHRLAGSGGTYGFPAISQAAHALELALDAGYDQITCRPLLDALAKAVAGARLGAP